MTLGERIKFVRKANKLNQTEFAEQLGISQTHVSKIEKNIENPSETLLLLISYLFATNIDWLKNGQGESEINDNFALIRYKLENQRKYLNSDCDFELRESFFYFEKILSFALKKYSNPYDFEKMKDYIESFEMILRNISFIGVDFKNPHKCNTKTISKNDRLVNMLYQSVTDFITEHLNVEK